jgi:hypothetical protein
MAFLGLNRSKFLSAASSAAIAEQIASWSLRIG